MGLEAVLVVPRTPVQTKLAREALPDAVPLADAAFNVAAAATLVLGLSTANWDLIAAGLRDRIHQPYRAHLYPRSAELLERATTLGALGATISGAGPTVMFWCHYDQTAGSSKRCSARPRVGRTSCRAPFESQGADVREL